MTSYEIQSILMNTCSFQEVHVSGDGNHFQIIAVSKEFDGMSSVKKQKFIYAPLMKYILSNDIHALSIKAYSPKEWKNTYQLNTLKCE